jgi:flagellar biosynthesis anti-sigma factor FlgM
MRIDPNTPATGSSGASRADEVQAGKSKSQPSPVINEPNDTVQLSSGQATVRQLVSQLSQVPDIRQGQVSALRSAIGSGTYHPSNEQVAGALAGQSFGISEQA